MCLPTKKPGVYNIIRVSCGLRYWNQEKFACLKGIQPGCDVTSKSDISETP